MPEVRLQPQATCAPATRSSANRTAAILGLVFGAVGCTLGLIDFVAQLATLVVSGYGATSYSWLLAVIGGVIGLWPSLIGLVLGLVAFFGARRQGASTRLARWALSLSVTGPVAVGAGLLVLYVAQWTA